MIKIASLALAASLGLASFAQSSPAEARPFIRVGVGLPMLEPIAVVGPYGRYYYDGYRPYWRPGYVRFERERYDRHGYRR
jgi:hypothetical protein